MVNLRTTFQTVISLKLKADTPRLSWRQQTQPASRRPGDQSFVFSRPLSIRLNSLYRRPSQTVEGL